MYKKNELHVFFWYFMANVCERVCESDVFESGVCAFNFIYEVWRLMC